MLDDLVLISEVGSASADVAITPLTTVLVSIDSEVDRAAVYGYIRLKLVFKSS